MQSVHKSMHGHGRPLGITKVYTLINIQWKGYYLKADAPPVTINLSQQFIIFIYQAKGPVPESRILNNCKLPIPEIWWDGFRKYSKTGTAQWTGRFVLSQQDKGNVSEYHITLSTGHKFSAKGANACVLHLPPDKTQTMKLYQHFPIESYADDSSTLVRAI